MRTIPEPLHHRGFHLPEMTTTRTGAGRTEAEARVLLCTYSRVYLARSSVSATSRTSATGAVRWSGGRVLHGHCCRATRIPTDDFGWPRFMWSVEHLAPAFPLRVIAVPDFPPCCFLASRNIRPVFPFGDDAFKVMLARCVEQRDPCALHMGAVQRP